MTPRVTTCAPIAKLCLCVLAFVLFLGHGLPLAAQLTSIGNDVARPVPGRGHDYIDFLAETVNPANGSVNLNIQLPAPKARGLSLPVSILYNSGSVHRFASGAAGGGQMIQDASSITSSGWGGFAALFECDL